MGFMVAAGEPGRQRVVRRARGLRRPGGRCRDTAGWLAGRDRLGTAGLARLRKVGRDRLGTAGRDRLGTAGLDRLGRKVRAIRLFGHHSPSRYSQ